MITYHLVSHVTHARSSVGHFLQVPLRCTCSESYRCVLRTLIVARSVFGAVEGAPTELGVILLRQRYLQT